MKVLLFVCSLFVVVFTTPTTLHLDSKWHHFKLTHSKTYGNLDEEQKRYTIFNENLQEIEEHNKRYEQGLTTYRKGINKFTDWTHDEFVSYLTTQIIPQPEIVGTFVPPSNIQLPSAIDWRKKGAVTRVKDQGMCGSCWSFSATGSLEGQNAIKTGKLAEFSEQELVDCVKENAHGCKGGRVDAAFTYVKENGLTYENEYVYERHARHCRREGKPEAVRVNGFVNLDRNNETALQIAVATIGPISINVDSTLWQLYDGGIFSDDCSFCHVNHAVLIVGYGTSEKGVDYWIIKNSWASDWGEEGYMRLIRGQNVCLVAYQALYPVL